MVAAANQQQPKEERNKKTHTKTETKTKRIFICFFLLLLRLRHNDPNTHSIHNNCVYLLSVHRSLKRSIDYFLLRIVIFRILFYEKQNGKETCRSSPVAADCCPVRPRPADPARPNRILVAFELTIFYRYILNLFIWYDTYHDFWTQLCVAASSPHEVFVYVGRFLLSVIAAVLSSRARLVVVCAGDLVFLLIVTWSLIFMFSG